MSDDNSILQDDLRDMLRALGMGDHARPQSPHEVFRECIKEVKRLRSENATYAARHSVGEAVNYFLCIKCGAHFATAKPTTECPVCGWKRRGPGFGGDPAEPRAD